jgi:hypothetical protein
MLHDDEGQHRTLLECRPKPYVLDDVTVDRVIRVFTQQKDELPVYEEKTRNGILSTLRNF